MSLSAFFATTAKGTETALRDELRELRFRGVRADRGGVHFEGTFDEGWRACLELRVAVRVLWQVGEFEAPTVDALYDGVHAIDWSEVLSPKHTLAVRAACRSSALTHTQFISQKTKDAVVDQLRDRFGSRPSVDLDDPDVQLFVHLVRDRATVYLDLAGEPLHKRGYRLGIIEAPLKETLAAAILRLSGWDRERPLLDPMCGSGTLPIEAALWARRVAPGLLRERFGFERWASHGEAAQARAQELRERVRALARPDAPLIIGSDVDPRMLGVAKQAARRAGLKLRFEQRAIADVWPLTPPGHIVTNPPYGERLPAAAGVYDEIGALVKRLRGHRVSVLAGAPSIVRAIHLAPSATHVVFNGPLECRLLTYDVPA